MLLNINLFISQFIFNTILNDTPEPWQLGFQDSAAPGFSGIVELHNTIFFYLIVICVAVFWMLASIMYYFNTKNNPIIHKYLNHGTFIELIWTITPALVLIAIAFPSFRLLYVLDEVIAVAMTIKVTGHQWYWSYEYSDYITESGDPIEFDSYMVPDSDLELGQFRLLEVDNSAMVPVDCHVRVIVTADDVLHDFAVPSLGLKIDATPGRLNQASFISERTGEYQGMCSELCGVYHANMPISIVALDEIDFLLWLEATATGSLFINSSVNNIISNKTPIISNQS